MGTFILACLLGLVISWSIAFRDTKTAKYPTKLPTKEDGQRLLVEIDRIRKDRAKIKAVEAEIENTKRKFEVKKDLCDQQFQKLTRKI